MRDMVNCDFMVSKFGEYMVNIMYIDMWEGWVY